MKHYRVAIVLLVVGFAAGCGLVEVSEVRQAQEDFSKLAKQENEVTGNAVFNRPSIAGGDTKFADLTKLTSAFSNQEAVDLHRGYYELHQRLVRLESDASGTLVNDQLYGVTASLRVLASWRSTFFAHLTRTSLRAPEEGSGTVDGGAPGPDEELPKMLNEVVVEAEAVESLASAGTIKLFPRDAFLLKAMNAFARYDIAYLTALEYSKAGKLEKTQDNDPTGAVKSLVAQMAQSENELHDKFWDSQKNDWKSESAHFASYITLARMVMLTSATGLVLKVFPGLDTDAAATAFPLLKTRLDAFRTEAVRKGSVAYTFLQGLGVTDHETFIDLTIGTIGP